MESLPRFTNVTVVPADTRSPSARRPVGLLPAGSTTWTSFRARRRRRARPPQAAAREEHARRRAECPAQGPRCYERRSRAMCASAPRRARSCIAQPCCAHLLGVCASRTPRNPALRTCRSPRPSRSRPLISCPCAQLERASSTRSTWMISRMPPVSPNTFSFAECRRPRIDSFVLVWRQISSRAERFGVPAGASLHVANGHRHRVDLLDVTPPHLPVDLASHQEQRGRRGRSSTPFTRMPAKVKS